MIEYIILIGGRLHAKRAAWFDGMALGDVAGDTLLRGGVPDQTALHGILARIRDLNLPLIAETRADMLTLLHAGLHVA